MTADYFETPSGTPDFKTELASKLAEIAPEVVADGKVDFERIKELLGDDIGDERERFGLFWPGKLRALRAAQAPTTATLKPDFESSKDWDTTKNIFVEGDNLEVLKILQRHYHGKIKMIYIDPPYNTGKDFIYPDNYKEGLDSYLEWTKQVNEEGQKLSTNSESDGRYHSNWLNMMYPRLKLARNLLSDDGVIFMSIDDHEVSNLRALCDGIFGEANFVGQLVWKKGGTGKNDSKFQVVEHEYVLVYARKASAAAFNLDLLAEVTTSYNREDSNGKYSLVRLDSKTLGYVESLDYEILDQGGVSYLPEQPSGKNRQARWRWSKSKVAEQFDELVFENGYVYTKNYQKDGAKPRSLMAGERFGVTRTGKADAERALGQSGVFDFPKPVNLIKHLVNIASDPDSLVLDFFAGSGTTAQAVMESNSADGGDRKWILVQLPEPVPVDSEAAALGYQTIAEISRKRICGAAKNISDGTPETLVTSSQRIDLGFRSYQLIRSQFTKWQSINLDEVEKLQQHLIDIEKSADDNATCDELLIEVLLKQGYSLTEAIQTIEISGLEVMSVDENLVLAYMNEHVKPSLEQLRDLIAFEPVRVVILEDAFQGDDELKSNLVQLCKSKKIELWTA